MDYFNGISNEDFKNYFLKDLNCLSELTWYIYPSELIEEHNAVDEHIVRCQSNLEKYILHSLQNDTLSNEESNRIYEAKKLEVIHLVLPEMEDFCLKVKVNYIQL